MKQFVWDDSKNEQLKKERKISFEEIQLAFDDDKLLDDKTHPNKKRYPSQRIAYVLIDDYVYLVPYIEDKDKIFLKTIIPSRKATRDYFNQSKQGEQT